VRRSRSSPARGAESWYESIVPSPLLFYQQRLLRFLLILVRTTFFGANFRSPDAAWLYMCEAGSLAW
jgi:hypothetical protein